MAFIAPLPMVSLVQRKLDVDASEQQTISPALKPILAVWSAHVLPIY